MDYIYPRSLEDTYLVAGTGVDCFLFWESHPVAVAEEDYFHRDKSVEIVELMLIECGRLEDENYDPRQLYFDGMGL